MVLNKQSYKSKNIDFVSVYFTPNFNPFKTG